ncbi:hypothetical protein B7494_g7808 [Chlorociboria aeruginascens]|nr:hypothetical protein B7494_g7808 [Chlorociboria aeruginascens]
MKSYVSNDNRNTISNHMTLLHTSPELSLCPETSHSLFLLIYLLIIISMSSTREQIPPRRKRQHTEAGLLLDDPSELQPSKRLKSSKEEFYDSISKYPAPADVDRTRAMSSSRSSPSRHTKSTVLTSVSSKTRRSSAYDKDFEQHYIDNRALDNFDQNLLRLRPSLSPSRFTASNFRDFERKNNRVIDKGEFMRDVMPIIAGDANIPNKQNLLLTRLESITSNITVDPKPNFYDGPRLKNIDKSVREKLGPFIVPAGHRTAPVAPNFFLEVKASRGGIDVARRQALQDGAYGARAMHSLQSYCDGKLVYDGNAYTITTTYHDGQLKMYTTHPTRGKDGISPEYHMTQRDTFTIAANERARSTNPELTRTERMAYPDWLATLDKAQEPPASSQDSAYSDCNPGGAQEETLREPPHEEFIDMGHGADDLSIKGVRLSGKPVDTRWDVCCRNGVISSIYVSGTKDSNRGRGGHLLTPSLCHPHIHLDKCFLLSHEKFADLEIQKGDFTEALSLTSQAKSRFDHTDLKERGRILIEESISFGVTHMRAFVEVDPGVGLKCLEAGLDLKKEYQDRCYVQICVFAQDPIFSYEDGGKEMIGLLEEAVKFEGVEVIGSTPYVEKPENAVANIRWAVDTAKKYKLHLDFHIDYNLDPEKEPLVPKAIDYLKEVKWALKDMSHHQSFRTIVFGHCTRLTLFTSDEWYDLRKNIGDLPISFVGLPTSDVFMMGRPDEAAGGGERARGTLQVVQMIKKYDLNAAIGINNVGNAFTPYGSCDPLRLASLAVGIYQAGTKSDAEVLFQSISSRARTAIGLGSTDGIEVKVGDPADFVLFNETKATRPRKSIQDLVYDAEMRDPFPFPPPLWLSRAVQPFSDYFYLTTLPLHIHEVLGSFALYTFINWVVAPQISRRLFPLKYTKLSPERKLNWDVHVVSLCQSTLINILALWVMYVDEDRKGMDWQQRVWGYTGAAGMIQGLATGYFLWDLMVTLLHVEVFGYGMLAHALSALLVFSFGYRPFVNYYGCTFILYELSSPFLNFHWFFDKLDMTGSRPQLYNGIALLVTFFGCRLVWGTYQSVRVYQDVWAAINHKPATASIHLDALHNGTSAAVGTAAAPIHDDIMQFAGEEFVPLWLAFAYLGSNIILNTLNFFWFGKMIETVRKRFQPPKEERRTEKAIAIKSTGVNGSVMISADEIRRRNIVDDEVPNI